MEEEQEVKGWWLIFDSRDPTICIGKVEASSMQEAILKGKSKFRNQVSPIVERLGPWNRDIEIKMDTSRNRGNKTIRSPYGTRSTPMNGHTYVRLSDSKKTH